MFDLSGAGYIVFAVIGGVVWAVRLEGRINSHDNTFIEREKLDTVRNTDLKERLERIERKLDVLPATLNLK